MPYSEKIFIKTLKEGERLIQIQNNDLNVVHTIEPFSIVNTRISNNLLVINTKRKTIKIDFSTTNEAKLALLRIQVLIDGLKQNTPYFISKEIEKYLEQEIQDAVGPDGPQGFQGLEGATGPMGFQGSFGYQGPEGVAGVQGSEGYQGPQGNFGPQGVMGFQGNDGEIGEVGPQGSTGPQGNNGSQGSIGPQGTEGDVGPQGTQGLSGPQGVDGEDGSLGPQGPQGLMGEVGPQGLIGSTGPSAVGTVNYFQNAVTSPVQITTTNQNIATLTVTSYGNPIFFSAYGDANPIIAGGWVKFYITRDGAKVSNEIQVESSEANENVPYAISFIDDVPAGTYVYAMRVSGLLGNFNFGEISGPTLTAYELGGVSNQNINIDGDLNVGGYINASNTSENIYSFNIPDSGVYEYNFGSASIWYHDEVNSDYVANFTNMPLNDNRVYNAKVIINQGLTPSKPSSIQIDGINVITKWESGINAANSSKVDIMNFSFYRLGESWVQVLGKMENYSVPDGTQSLESSLAPVLSEYAKISYVDTEVNTAQTTLATSISTVSQNLVALETNVNETFDTVDQYVSRGGEGVTYQFNNDGVRCDPELSATFTTPDTGIVTIIIPGVTAELDTSAGVQAILSTSNPGDGVSYDGENSIDARNYFDDTAKAVNETYTEAKYLCYVPNIITSTIVVGNTLSYTLTLEPNTEYTFYLWARTTILGILANPKIIFNEGIKVKI